MAYREVKSDCKMIYNPRLPSRRHSIAESYPTSLICHPFPKTFYLTLWITIYY